MHVIIAGGGIGGLTLAPMLHKRGIKTTLYEQASAMRELGVGINTLPYAIKELAELDLLERLDDIAIRTKELIYLNRFGQEVWREWRGMWAGAPGVRRRWGRYRSNTAVSRQTPSEPTQKQRFARRSGLIQTQTSAYDLLLRSNGKSSMRIGLPGLWWYRAFANRADGMLSIRSFTHCLSRCIAKVTGFIAFWLPASTIVAISVGPST